MFFSGPFFFCLSLKLALLISYKLWWGSKTNTSHLSQAGCLLFSLERYHVFTVIMCFHIPKYLLTGV